MSSFVVTYTNPPKRRVLLKRNSSKTLVEPTSLHLNTDVKQTGNGRKKTVRFRDDNIEHVRYFYKSQTPSTVKNDPPMMELSSHDFKLTLPNWPIRNPLQLGDTRIRMESVDLTEGDTDQMKNNELNLEGRCRVNNLSFEKLVTVRYSLDLWNTSYETTASFRESIPSTHHQWDRFTFTIPVKAKNDTQIIYLALKYTVDNQEYWDNNNGKNYEIVMTPTTTNATMKEDAVDNQCETQNGRINLVLNKTKVLGRRYDFGASLSAARKPLSPPPSPPVSPVDLIHKRPGHHHSYTPSLFYNNTLENDRPIDSQHKAISPEKNEPTSEPIPIKSSNPVSADGYQMSYSDFINKYCFYNPNHINNFSTSPSAVLS